MIEAEGLTWSVVESIPVTNAIKAQTTEWRHDVDAWKETLRALGRAGIRTVCYNFMPIVDWTRTDLAYPLKSGLALRFDIVDFAAYDVFVLQRPGAGGDYDAATVAAAESPLRRHARRTARRNWSGSSSPASPARTSPMTGQNSSISSNAMPAWGRTSSARASTEFLNEVVPVAEEFGIRLGIHPDDPPFPLFGLPRIVSTADDAAGFARRL